MKSVKFYKKIFRKDFFGSSMSIRLWRLVIFSYLLVAVFTVVSDFMVNDGFWLHFFHNFLIGLSVVIALFGLFSMRNRLREMEKEKKKIEKKALGFTEELKDVYQHMGTVNRRIEMIKNIIVAPTFEKKDISINDVRDVFLNILSSATASVGADWGVLRFLNVKTKRIIVEYCYNPRRRKLPNLPSNFLVKYFENRVLQAEHFFVTPDRRDGKIIAFFVFPKNKEIIEADESFLTAFANQAQLIFSAFMERK